MCLENHSSFELKLFSRHMQSRKKGWTANLSRFPVFLHSFHYCLWQKSRKIQRWVLQLSYLCPGYTQCCGGTKWVFSVWVRNPTLERSTSWLTRWPGSNLWKNNHCFVIPQKFNRHNLNLSDCFKAYNFLKNLLSNCLRTSFWKILITKWWHK